VQVDRLDWEYINEWFTWVKEPPKVKTRAKASMIPPIEQLSPQERIRELHAEGYRVTQVLRQEGADRIWLRWGRPKPTT
jgi:hypothetical protein